ncbi:MAG: 50S ribosomal protein L25 [Patescibacteria group bacterium]
MTITLNATKRSETGSAARRLLKDDRMPAVVYGPKQESMAITLVLPEFKKVLRDAGESSIIELTGLGSSLQVLIHDVDRDPVTTLPRHADFYAIEKGAKVEVSVPLVFVGESAAVKAGANLVKVMHELDVVADASSLPHELEVDISVLAEIGAQIHVKDIKLPKGVETPTDVEEVVVLVQEASQEEETDTAAPDMDAIEVEQKGKGEGEAEEEAPAAAE